MVREEGGGQGEFESSGWGKRVEEIGVGSGGIIYA